VLAPSEAGPVTQSISPRQVLILPLTAVIRPRLCLRCVWLYFGDMSGSFHALFPQAALRQTAMGSPVRCQGLSKAPSHKAYRTRKTCPAPSVLHPVPHCLHRACTKALDSALPRPHGSTASLRIRRAVPRGCGGTSNSRLVGPETRVRAAQEDGGIRARFVFDDHQLLYS